MTPALPTYSVRGQTAFWRSYSLRIEGLTGSGVKFGNVEVGASSLRMTFSIERNFSGPGPRNLVLYNLTDKTRALLRKGATVVIEAGYNRVVGTIMIGQIMKVKTERAGPDVTTTMELIDSEAFARGCSIQTSYAPAKTPGAKGAAGGVWLTQVLTDIAKAMRLTYDPTKPVVVRGGVAVGIQNPRLTAGLTLNHACGDALDLVLNPQNLMWNISNGALNIVPLDAYDGSPVLTLNKGTGLINTPSLNEFEHVTFDALMNYQLSPNCVVQIDLPQQTLYTGRENNPLGFFKVIKTVHRGDTHGGAWDVGCEAQVFRGGFKTVPVASGNKFENAVVP